MCAGVLAASLMLDLTSEAVGAVARMGSGASWSTTTRLARLVTAVFVLSALLRVGHVAAATPPPMHRIEHSHTPRADARAPTPEGVAVLGVDDSKHVVVSGECLWRIARQQLEAAGSPALGADISRLWRAIYAENRSVIGDDPDLILPGQILTIPGELNGT